MVTANISFLNVVIVLPRTLWALSTGPDYAGAPELPLNTL